jgi:hypothetical protein
LTAARSDIEIAYRRLNLGGDILPIELGVLINDVCRRSVAQRFVEPDLFKFVEQRVRLPQIVGIAELADRIGGPQRQPLLFDQTVIRGYRIRKASIFDCPGNSVRIQLFNGVQALEDEQFRTVHMIRSKRGIGRSSRQTNGATSYICNIGLVFISLNNSANVSDVMGEARQNEIRIIVCCRWPQQRTSG